MAVATRIAADDTILKLLTCFVVVSMSGNTQALSCMDKLFPSSSSSRSSRKSKVIQENSMESLTCDFLVDDNIRELTNANQQLVNKDSLHRALSRWQVVKVSFGQFFFMMLCSQTQKCGNCQ